LKLLISVCSCEESPLPGLNGTLTLEPAFLIAFSSPTLPARIIVSAIVAPVFLAILSRTFKTFESLLGSLAFPILHRC